VSVDAPVTTRKDAAVTVLAVRKHRWLFFGLSIVILTVVATAFAPTFYLRTTLSRTDTLLGNSGIPAHLIVHGTILTAWFVLSVVQTWLIASRHTRLHTRLGVVGVVTAVAVVASGAYTVAPFVPRLIGAIRATGRTADQ
jgi:hypothetical protein